MSDFYRFPRWKKLSPEIFKRDKGRCADCGRTKKNRRDLQFDVHHELPRAEFPGLEYDQANLILLCHDCHERRHGLAANDDLFDQWELPLA